MFGNFKVGYSDQVNLVFFFFFEKKAVLQQSRDILLKSTKYFQELHYDSIFLSFAETVVRGNVKSRHFREKTSDVRACSRPHRYQPLRLNVISLALSVLGNFEKHCNFLALNVVLLSFSIIYARFWIFEE